jgi:hypothetical protein
VSWAWHDHGRGEDVMSITKEYPGTENDHGLAFDVSESDTEVSLEIWCHDDGEKLPDTWTHTSMTPVQARDLGRALIEIADNMD